MIKLKNISKFYSKNQTVSLGLRKVNLELGLHEFVAIVGESGSGKTTLLNVISGIDSYEEGELYLNQEETSYYSKEDWENYRKKYIAFIFQNYNLIESYTVLQNVEAALILSGYPKEQLRSRALSIIDRVGLTQHIKHKATKLSGGQKQRVVIARAIAKDAPIIVADEPTGNLDSESADNIIRLLAEIAKEKLVIVVTHDFKQLENYATRRLRIFDGEIVEDKKLVPVKASNLPILEDKDYKMNFLETIKIVLRNLVSTPKKSLMLFIIFAISIFFFAFSYATFLDARSSFSSSNYNFGFIPPTRIIVNKTNGEAFTNSELSNLDNRSKVQAVVPFDYIMQEYWFENYSWIIYVNDPKGPYTDYFYFRILPQSLLKTDDQYGIDDVVIALPSYYSDEDAQKYLNQDLTFGILNYQFSFDVKSVIKTTDSIHTDFDEYASYVFVSDFRWNQLGKIYGFNQIATSKLSYTNGGVYDTYDLTQYTIVLNAMLEENQIRVPRSIGPSSVFQASLVIDGFYESINQTNVSVTQFSGNSIELNETMYNQLFDTSAIYQVSIFANDAIEARQLLNELSTIKEAGELKYQVYYPADARTGSSLEGLILIILNFGLTLVFGLIFLALYFVSYAIIKNIINSKMTDYAIFRTIGANKNTIRGFIYLETLFMAFFAYLIFVIIVQSVTPFVQPNSALFVLKYFDLRYLFYLLIFVSLFSALLSRRYLSRVYHDTVADTLRSESE